MKALKIGDQKISFDKWIRNRYRYKTSLELNRTNLPDLYKRLHLDNKEYISSLLGKEVTNTVMGKTRMNPSRAGNSDTQR